ncbi:MAG TPA: hypothetical protein VFT72_01190 [Opitutaceae bacterium]|nr:hypothetical protein [Opitutaceae bacterium]
MTKSIGQARDNLKLTQQQFELSRLQFESSMKPSVSLEVMSDGVNFRNDGPGILERVQVYGRIVGTYSLDKKSLLYACEVESLNSAPMVAELFPGKHTSIGWEALSKIVQSSEPPPGNAPEHQVFAIVFKFQRASDHQVFYKGFQYVRSKLRLTIADYTFRDKANRFYTPLIAQPGAILSGAYPSEGYWSSERRALLAVCEERFGVPQSELAF